MSAPVSFFRNPVTVRAEIDEQLAALQDLITSVRAFARDGSDELLIDTWINKASRPIRQAEGRIRDLRRFRRMRLHELLDERGAA